VTAIQQNRWDQLLRRSADLKGPGSKVNDALSELFPTFDVENVPGELFFLMGTILAHGGAKVIAGVTDAPRLQLFNPVGSGKILTVTSIILTTGSSENVRGTVENAPLTTVPAIELSRDGRMPATSRPTGQIRTDATPAFTDATVQFSMAADIPFLISDPNGLAILPPGTGYEWGNGSVNSTLAASFWWRERTAEPSELNL